MTDKPAFLEHLRNTLAGIEAEGLTKHERQISGAQGAHVMIGGRSMVNLCANNYLGLAGDDRLIAAAKAAMDAHGRARIRTQMNAALTRADLDFALDAFAATGREVGALS